MDENASKPCHDFQKSGLDIWYLSILEVDPSAQWQGVGSQFLTYMEEYVRERGGKQLALHDSRKIGSWSMKKNL